jgi:hypothetical protein
MIGETLGALGDAFDKFTGSRALRGVLAGRGREAMSMLPFSDTLGLTDASQKASGLDVLKSFGFENASPIAGMAAEMALDPLGAVGAAAGAVKGVRALRDGSRLTRRLGDMADAEPLAARLGEIAGGVGSPMPELSRAHVGLPEKVNPLADRMAEFMADESGQLKLSGHAYGPKTGRLAGDLAESQLDDLRSRAASPDQAQAAYFLGERNPQRSAQELKDLIGQVPGHRGPFPEKTVDNLVGSIGDTLSRELRPGDVPLGRGAEGLVFGSPESSSVLRVEMTPDKFDPVARVRSPLNLSPLRSVFDKGYTLERVPKMNILGATEMNNIAENWDLGTLAQILDPQNPNDVGLARDLLMGRKRLNEGLMRAATQAFREADDAGQVITDWAPAAGHNFGVTPQGRMALFDPANLMFRKLPGHGVVSDFNVWEQKLQQKFSGANQIDYSKIPDSYYGKKAVLAREVAPDRFAWPVTQPTGAPYWQERVRQAGDQMSAKQGVPDFLRQGIDAGASADASGITNPLLADAWKNDYPLSRDMSNLITSAEDTFSDISPADVRQLAFQHGVQPVTETAGEDVIRGMVQQALNRDNFVPSFDSSEASRQLLNVIRMYGGLAAVPPGIAALLQGMNPEGTNAA